MKRLALLVGTSEYPDCDKLPPLHGSLLDVDAMQRVLVANGEFAAEDVVVLKNASRQAIEDAIHNLFNTRDRQKDDLVLFYFSGHGVVDEANKLFLGTPSTRKEGNKIVKPTTVAATYLQEAMNDSKSQHQVLILNCCFSGAFAQGMTVMDDGSVNLKNQLGGKGRAILTSSSSTQFSFQPDGEMSIYTRYLVEGIETGAADRDGDRKISIDELHEYAALKVSQESPNMTPAFYPVEQGGKIY
ncbi:MAG: caspase domain-containing protein, partial [Pseudanabaena sp.]